MPIGLRTDALSLEVRPGEIFGLTAREILTFHGASTRRRGSCSPR